MVNIARTVVIHIDMRFPKGTMKPELWPVAMDHTVCIYNRIQMSPIEVFASHCKTIDVIEKVVNN